MLIGMAPHGARPVQRRDKESTDMDMPTKPKKADFQARHPGPAPEGSARDWQNGAVTDTYRADRETVLRLLNEALATELVCVLRYKRHFLHGARHERRARGR